MKLQATTTRDGMIFHLFEPFVGRRHDWYMYLLSGIDQILPEALQIEIHRYCVWGDPGYNNRCFLETPSQGENLTPTQQAFNTAMLSIRISVEWTFKEVKLYWSTVDYKRKLKLRESPVALIYQVSALPQNLRNIFYPSQSSKYFNCKPPKIEQYLENIL